MEKAREFAMRHPQLIVAGAAILVVGNLLNLVEAIDVYHKARALVGELQREASEALGG